MSFKQISSVQAMMQVFWSFASQRQIITRSMKNAILSITIDEEAADFLESYIHFYNSFMQPKIEDGAWPVDEDRVKKYESQIKELNRRHQLELEKQNIKRKEENAKRNIKHQEELKVAGGKTKE